MLYSCTYITKKTVNDLPDFAKYLQNILDQVVKTKSPDISVEYDNGRIVILMKQEENHE